LIAVTLVIWIASIVAPIQPYARDGNTSILRVALEFPDYNSHQISSVLPPLLAYLLLFLVGSLLLAWTLCALMSVAYGVWRDLRMKQHRASE
jgi:hypothetical protein